MIESVVISSGHGKLIRGAKGYLDEVDEARRVTNRVAEMLRAAELEVKVYHDDASRTQSENLQRIVAFHNSQKRDLDVSVHFNAHAKTASPMGTEVLYLTQKQEKLAAEVARQISTAGGLKNRGAKRRNNLAFLNRTNKPAILVEVAFVDSEADTALYREHFEKICTGIAKAIAEHK